MLYCYVQNGTTRYNFCTTICVGQNKNLVPDIEPVYMSEKNSNHVKEIDDI